jgi:branched-chain amino acid transport system substrate-binding protein
MHTMKISRRSVVLVAAGMAPFMQSRSAEESGAIVIGQTISLSGPEAMLGREIVAGLNVYFDHVNARGGVHGRRIRLVTLDDAYDVETAAANVRDLVGKHRVVALVTPLGTATTARVAKESGPVPVLFPLTGTAGIRTPDARHVYYARATYAEEVQHIVDNGVSFGMRRLALIYSDDGFGKAGRAAFEAALAKQNLKPHALGVTPGFSSPQVQQAAQVVADSKPDAVLIYLPATFADAARALRQRRLSASIYGISVALTPDNLDKLGEHRRGVMFTQVVPPPNQRKFPVVAEYQQIMTAAGRAFSFGSLEGFINAKLIVEALRRAASPVNAARLEQALGSMAPYDAGGFFVSFDGGRRSGSRFVQVGIIDADGRLMN